ncbi:Uncharacterised protein [Mycoplasmopsis maculosa]|uniref:Uncharacterized protein n=1 Tax=Mycoplasmopsis maculosa TaxID=114885 RepID=A0A449B4R2_9BACT|nr:hypothetical protein [Mycoplasmopsis maculosa]VEU75597.1 Uncharacterised protein [Mycoplasmopsis maculosa]
MLLASSYNINNLPYIKRKEISNQYKYHKTIWYKILSGVLRFAISVGVSFASEAINVVAPGVGTLLDFSLNTVVDLLFNYFDNGFEIDLKEFGLSTATNLIPFVSKFLRVRLNTIKHNRFFSIADKVKLVNSELNNQLKQVGKVTNKFGTTAKIDKIGKYSFNSIDNNIDEIKRLFSENNKVLNSINISNANNKINNLKKTFNKAAKIMHYARTTYTLLRSPRYAAKKVTELILKKPYKALSDKWNNFVSKAIPKKFIKGTNKTIEQGYKNIILNSSWLDRVTIQKSNDPWNSIYANAIIKFQADSTNKKEPVFLFNKSLVKILELINSDSPGKYYLENFAWGWKIGALLRNYKHFISKSKIPAFLNIISNFNYLAKSILFVQNETISFFSAKKKKINWKDEILKGIKEEVTKAPKLKYLSGVQATVRSIATGSSFYTMNAASKIINKSILNHKIGNAVSVRYSGSTAKRVMPAGRGRKRK